MSRCAVVRLVLAAFLMACLLTGCSRDPNVRKQKYLESGNRYRDQSKYSEAAIQYSNAIQLDPRFVEAHYQLAQTYLKLQDYNHAYAELLRTVDLAPDHYPAQLDLANLLISAHDLNQASAHLDVLRAKQPNNPDTHEAWSNYYAAQNDPVSAIQEMQKAIAADPNRSESYLVLAYLQSGANLPDQAEASFKKAAALGPKAMNAQLALGGFYMSHNRLPEAEQQFKHAIEVDPKDTAARAAYARLLMTEGRKTDAEAFLKQTKIDLPEDSEGYTMLGDFYAATDVDKALPEYASLYRDHPKDPKVKKNYIQILILKNQLDEASKLTDEILKTSPHDGDALIFRAQIQIHHNDASSAIDSLQAALKNDSDNGVAHFWLGKAFDLQHNDARAESEWREAVRLRPDLSDAQLALANLEMRRGDVDALTQTALQLIANAPNAAEGYLMRALAEINRQRYSDAEQDLRKATELAPASPIPLVQTGNLHLAQKQYAEALTFYQRAFEKDAASTDALQGVMNTYLAEKQPDQAIAAARARIAKVPTSSGFYDLLGTSLFQNKNDLSGAEAAFRKAIDLDRNNSDALLKLGQVQASEGSATQALATYQQSIKDHPQDVAFYILAGELYESQSNWQQAKDMYQKALALQSDNALASNNLAYVILQQGGNVDVALSMAQTAWRGMPDSSNAADTLGWAYFQKGVYQSAIDMFQESLRLSEKKGAPEDPTVHYHLGLAYEKANQPKLARQQLERALKISPKFDDARKALSELRG